LIFKARLRPKAYSRHLVADSAPKFNNNHCIVILSPAWLAHPIAWFNILQALVFEPMINFISAVAGLVGGVMLSKVSKIDQRMSGMLMNGKIILSI